MRLIPVLLLVLFFLFVSTSRAITFYPNDSIPLGNITYRFFHNVTFDFVSVDNKTITFNNVTFDIDYPFPINITIDRILSLNNFNFTIESNRSGVINFTLSGNKIVIIYLDKSLVIEKGIDPATQIRWNTLENGSWTNNTFDFVPPLVFGNYTTDTTMNELLQLQHDPFQQFLYLISDNIIIFSLLIFLPLVLIIVRWMTRGIGF